MATITNVMIVWTADISDFFFPTVITGKKATLIQCPHTCPAIGFYLADGPAAPLTRAKPEKTIITATTIQLVMVRGSYELTGPIMVSIVVCKGYQAEQGASFNQCHADLHVRSYVPLLNIDLFCFQIRP